MGYLKSFKSFSEERVNQVVITFGRFQPPTVGHEKLINKVASIATGNNYRIFTSQTNDRKKNPLEYSDKVKFLRKMFPNHGRNIIEDKGIKTIFDAIVKLNKQGYTKLVIVVGDDRTDEFKSLILKYNGVESNHGFYDFRDGISIVSSGERDPDSESVTGMSASKMRKFAEDNNLEGFTRGLPKGFKEGAELFNAIRSGMGLKESFTHRQHVQLDSVSEERESYVKGELFHVGDTVVITESNKEGVIQGLGPNFVTVYYDNQVFRKWLTDVKKINK